MKHFVERERDYPPIKVKHRRVHLFPFVQIFSGKFVLEVLGASGAIWGSSEVLTFRNVESVEEWRLVAMIVGGLFLMRWGYLILCYCLCFFKLSSRLQGITSWMNIIIATFVLEVLGAAGAVWGFSEIFLLRQNAALWKGVALSVGVVFMIRWIRQTFLFFRERRARREANNDGIEVVYEEELGDLTFTESTV